MYIGVTFEEGVPSTLIATILILTWKMLLLLLLQMQLRLRERQILQLLELLQANERHLLQLMRWRLRWLLLLVVLRDAIGSRSHLRQTCCSCHQNGMRQTNTLEDLLETLRRRRDGCQLIQRRQELKDMLLGVQDLLLLLLLLLLLRMILKRWIELDSLWRYNLCCWR